jgi:hypothetical protein
MAMAVLLLDADFGETRIAPSLVRRLGRLGITHVSVVGDASGFALVVEGWAFDPASVDQVARLVGQPARRLRRPLCGVAISDRIGGSSDA